MGNDFNSTAAIFGSTVAEIICVLPVPSRSFTIPAANTVFNAILVRRKICWPPIGGLLYHRNRAVEMGQDCIWNDLTECHGGGVWIDQIDRG